MPFNKCIQSETVYKTKVNNNIFKKYSTLSFYQSKGGDLAMIMATAAKMSHY